MAFLQSSISECPDCVRRLCKYTHVAPLTWRSSQELQKRRPGESPADIITHNSAPLLPSIERCGPASARKASRSRSRCWGRCPGGSASAACAPSPSPSHGVFRQCRCRQAQEPHPRRPCSRLIERSRSHGVAPERHTDLTILQHPSSLLFFASFFLLPAATTEGRRAHGRCAAPRAGDRRSTRAGLHVHPLAPLGIVRNCGARSSIKPTCMCTILPVAHGSPTLPSW
ncbi:hypothetical protein DFJ74DRAFT_20743 [Hyaloraphidium curvatum]|nr:hypothetical protein DFJ74DRAFT_20743 [Hyaloraphidium curvatum]